MENIMNNDNYRNENTVDVENNGNNANHDSNSSIGGIDNAEND